MNNWIEKHKSSTNQWGTKLLLVSISIHEKPYGNILEAASKISEIGMSNGREKGERKLQ